MFEKWTSLIKKQTKPKIEDYERLREINETLKSGHPLTKSDKDYLEKKSSKLEDDFENTDKDLPSYSPRLGNVRRSTESVKAELEKQIAEIEDQEQKQENSDTKLTKRQKNHKSNNSSYEPSNSKIEDYDRLREINETLKSGHPLTKSDKNYLEKKSSKLEDDFENTDKDLPSYSPRLGNVRQSTESVKAKLEKQIAEIEDREQKQENSDTKLTKRQKNKKSNNSSYEPSNSKIQNILVDDFETEPTQNFDSLGFTVSNIIRSSSPHFTVGIYGEWGTGKTTLMKTIERNLKDEGIYENEQKIQTVWYNAWKHQREDGLAATSLLKTMAYGMENHNKFDRVSKTIMRGIGIVDRDVMPNITFDTIKTGGTEVEAEHAKKMELVNKLQRDSIYYDGLRDIEKQMDIVRQTAGNDYRVVVFIDDLDRCSPIKALEVLEAINLFVGIEGFVFVIGMSHQTATTLITEAYHITGINGDDYIKKIIQIPIKIPNWNQQNVLELINTKIVPNLTEEYSKFLLENTDIVAQVVGSNPRQLKRFINNVIIAFESFSKSEGSSKITLNEIYLIQILKAEWPKFYEEFQNTKRFRDIVKWMTTKPKELKKYFKYLDSPEDEEPIEQKHKRVSLLSNSCQTILNAHQIEIISDFNLITWDFLDNVKRILYGIKDWDVLDAVMDVIEDLPYNVSLKPKQNDSMKPKSDEP